MMMEETWKLITGSKGYYVSDLGRVKNSPKRSWNALCNCYSVHPEQILKPTYSFGYQYVGIKYQDGKTRRERVHRLVAQEFLENPNQYPFVNHKDGCKSNNSVDNLEWCDASQNMRHAYRTNLINKDNFRSIKSSQATPYKLFVHGRLCQIFGSQKELLAYLGVGKTKFKSPRYQAYLIESGMLCKKISKKEYFALEGSTTIPQEV